MYCILLLVAYASAFPSADALPQPQPDDSPFELERLAALYGSDKQRALHRYTNVYSSLFDNERLRILNVSEAGVLRGSSAHMWLDFFPKAHIFAMDVNFRQYREHPNHKQAESHRLHLLKCCNTQADIEQHRLVPDSMDVVIDDAGVHSLALQEVLFPLLWPLVRPGGWYIIEDVDPQRGGLSFTQNHSRLSPLLQRVLETQRAYMVDSTPGIPDAVWHKYQARIRRWPAVEGKKWVVSREVHNSHLLVIRRHETRHSGRSTTV